MNWAVVRMELLTNTYAKYSHLLTLSFNLRIRQLLLIVLGMLSLIAVMGLGLNATQAFNQYNNAEQMAGSNAISQQALLLNSLLARERGLTAALLASPDNLNTTTRQHLFRTRADSIRGLQQLFRELEERSTQPNIPTISQHLEEISQRLTLIRLQVDRSLNDNEPVITSSEWIAILSELIEEIAIINLIILVPTEEEDHAIRYGLFLSELFFTISENAGRERALISMVIAQQRSFSTEEYGLLDNYQHISALINKRMGVVLSLFPQTPSLIQAQADLNTIYHQRYQALRSTVLQHSRSNQPYPVNAIEWYNQATEAVDSILNLSHTVSLHFTEDIDAIKTQARYTVIALLGVLILVVAVFIFSSVATYRRIVIPLQELESSAYTIGKGDFTNRIRIQTNDEFGELGNAFEIMRLNLLGDNALRQSAENELRKLSTAIEQSVSSIVITNIDGTTEYVNPQFHKTTGYTADEVIGRKFNFTKSGETPKAIYADLWNTIKNGQVWHGELCNKKKNGEMYWDLVSISPVRNKQGEISHFISIQHDITERKELEQRLNFMAYHDELTELPNRTLLADRFDYLVNQARRSDNKLALLLLDLDRFKFVNDSLGHSIGDQLLLNVSKRLKSCSRDIDTIARYGGDEFVILADGFSGPEVITNIAKRITEIINEPMTIDGHVFHISTSIGISIWPDDGTNMDTLMRQADTAMYHAKKLGGDGFQFFTDELNVQASNRLKLENALHNAIQNNQFELYYQPQVSLATGEIVGAEALIRWNHPEIGIVSPLDFIPLAEETNLIQPIGDWVLETACMQAIHWRKNLSSDFLMAVNVSARQLDDEGFFNRLAEILDQSGLPPESLEIEITESSLMHQPDRMIDVLNTITSHGIKLAMDDFGTGYSSLSYLRRFPFDKLKIDRSFINEITHNPEDASIIRAIGEMAHSLNMTVIAEGVETDSQLACLKHRSCDEIQGYLISPPLPAEKFEQLLQTSTIYI